MEMDILVKVSSGLVAILGALFVTHLHRWKGKGVQAELLQKLEEAVKNNEHYTAAQLFYLLHGFRLRASDVASLIARDDSAFAIFVLRKRKGAVEYSSGVFQFRDLSRFVWFRRVWNIFGAVIGFALGGWVIVSFIAALFYEGPEAVVLIVLASILFVGFLFHFRDQYLDYRAYKLVRDQKLS